ncbi:Txe/YoeB family addiction module toxin [Capnocytophaga granulosa]
MITYGHKRNRIIFHTNISGSFRRLKIINKSGTPAVKKKIERIIQELQIAPEKGVGAPEQLKGKEGQVWSRTLNKKDRIVYEVIEDEKMVIISQFLGHYEDK